MMHHRRNVISQLPGTYNLQRGIAKFRSDVNRLKGGAQEILNLHCVGDSVTAGTGAGSTLSDFMNLSYPGILRTYLNATYGDMGYGVIPQYQHDFTTVTWNTFSSGWAREVSVMGFMDSRYTTTAGSTITIPFTGTGIRVFYYQNSAGDTFTLAVDGGEEVEYTSAGAIVNNQTIDITGLDSGDHSLVLKFTGTTGKLRFHGHMALNDSLAGIRVNQIGRVGSAASTFFTYAQARSCCTYPLSPDLTVLCMGINDCVTARDISVYEANMQLFISECLLYGEVLIVVPYLTRVYTAWPLYVSAMYRLAHANNCGLLDINKMWVDATKTVDGVHPNPAGHADIAARIIQVIRA